MTHLDLAERGISRRSLMLPFTVYDTCDIKLERGAAGCRSRGGTNFPGVCFWQGAKNSDTPEMPYELH